MTSAAALNALAAKSNDGRHPQQIEALSNWYDVRVKPALQAVKRQRIASGKWPTAAKYRPLPHPAHVVKSSLHAGHFDGVSDSERELLHWLEYLRDERELPAHASHLEGIHGTILEDGRGVVVASLNDLRILCKWKYKDRVTRTARRLDAKGIVRPWNPHENKPADRRASNSRECAEQIKTVWVLPRYADVVEGWRTNPAIATDERGYVWYVGRGRRFLTPDEFAEWSIGSVPPRAEVADAPVERKLPTFADKYDPRPDEGTRRIGAIRPEPPKPRPVDIDSEPLSETVVRAIERVIGLADDFVLRQAREVRKLARDAYAMELTDDELAWLYREADKRRKVHKGEREAVQPKWYGSTIIGLLSRACSWIKSDREERYRKETEAALYLVEQHNDEPTEDTRRCLAAIESGNPDLWWRIADKITAQ